MTIEISPTEYWAYLNYKDSELYCSLVIIDGKNDWRMISYEEWIQYLGLQYDEKFNITEGWVIPVRDI